MPELAEIHLASHFINKVAAGIFFRTPVVKSDVSKMKDLVWNSPKYTIQSTARGKELQMVLTDIAGQDGVSAGLKTEEDKKLTLTFGFGMSGKFSYDRFDQIPKHAHLQFFTTETPANVLSFVDYRRFGKWDVRNFDLTRGPDPVLNPKEFRTNVLTHLDKSVFRKAICDVLMDQAYFNGIGNYLRAEILFRAKIPPFTQASGLLENLPVEHEIDPVAPDLLDLCSIVPKEVFGFAKPTQGYTPGSKNDIYVHFDQWLRCYGKPGMTNLVDSTNRTMWFSGPPGPMVPAKNLTRHDGKRKKAEGSGAVSKKPRSKIAVTDGELPDASVEADVPAAEPKKRKKSAAVPQPKPEPTTSLSRGDKRGIKKLDAGESVAVKIELLEPDKAGGSSSNADPLVGGGTHAPKTKSGKQHSSTGTGPIGDTRSAKKKTLPSSEPSAELRRSTRIKPAK